MTNSRQSAFWILIVFFFITVISGFWGWLEHYGWSQWSDALYHTLLAFVGDDSYIPAANTGIAIARFAGLATTISAVIGVAAYFLGEQVKRLWASCRSSHIVLIGSSDFALDFATRLGRVTVFDTSEALSALTPSRSKALRISDRMNEFTGTGLSLGRYPHAVVFGMPDTIYNVERARLWLSAIPKEKVKDTELILRVENKLVARDLHILSDDLKMAKLISRSDTIARSLVTAMAPTAMAVLRGQERVHVALVGLGSVNLAIAEELALRCHDPRLGSLRLTVVDRAPEEAEARLRAERPDLLNPDFGPERLEIRFIDLDALQCCAAQKAQALLTEESAVALTAIVVAAGEDALNAAIAMRLRRLQLQMLRLKAPIFMRSDSSSSVAPRPFDDLTGGIVPFGGRKLDADDMELERVYDELAEEIHNRWRNNLPEEDKTDQNLWENMPSAERRSSFRAALSSVELFYAAGFVPTGQSRLAGLRLEPHAGNATLGNDSQIDALSQTEHERWNTERLLEGFRTADDKLRDNEKQAHPLIVPFSDLPEDQPKKDVSNVKAALNFGIALYEAAPDQPCWRKICRIGVVGPIEIDEDRLSARLSELVDALMASDITLKEQELEILTPNAPGFDRIAAYNLAQAWHTSTGRSAAILTLNAVSERLLDERAASHIVEKQTTPLSPDERQDVLDGFRAQAKRLAVLRDSGHRLRQIDLRPLGASDAEIDRSDEDFEKSIARSQAETMRLADHMIFGTSGGAGRWTTRAVELWRKLGNTPLEC